MNQRKNIQKRAFRANCHFKQVEDNSCFSFKFVDKKECQTCWKRYEFMAEYMPIKKEHEKRQEQYHKVRSGIKGKAMNWWEYLY